MIAMRVTKDEEKLMAIAAFEEAKYWYNLVERFVCDKPVLLQLNARLAVLARAVGETRPE